MKHLLLLFLFMTYCSVISQNYNGEFLFKTTAYDIRSSLNDDGDIQIDLNDKQQKKVSFKMRPMNLSIFQAKFYDNFQELAEIDSLDRVKANNISKIQFFNILAGSLQNYANQGAVSGTLKIKDEIRLYNKFKTKNCSTKFVIKVKDVEIEFYEGYIETLKVEGKLEANNFSGSNDEKCNILVEGKDLEFADSFTFSNKYSIGFSTRENFKNLSDTFLYAERQHKENLFIKLGDVFDYDYKVRSSTKDFSPGNQTVYSYGGKEVELRKEKLEKLVEMIMFTDVQGYNNDNPNGIIQTELTRRINLWTHRIQAADWLVIAKAFGFLQYIKPSLVISKIEENKFALTPMVNDSINIDPEGNRTYQAAISTSPIEILNYQNSSVGADLNFMLLENSTLKFNLEVNGGFRYGRTKVRDSLRRLNEQTFEIEKTGRVNEFVLDYVTVYPELRLILFPEEEFNFSMSYKHLFFTRAFNEIDVVSYDKDLNTETEFTRGINILEMMVRLKLGSGMLFGRWRWHAQNENVRQNFQQLQIGYAFNILK